MNITQLIYLSRSVRPMTQDDLNSISDSAARNNGSMGLTGALLYVGGNFMQLLEGEDKEVMSLISVIQKDPRHQEFRIVKKTTQEKRLFPNWSMNVINVEKWSKEQRSEFVSIILDSETPGRLQLDRIIACFRSFETKSELNPA